MGKEYTRKLDKEEKLVDWIFDVMGSEDMNPSHSQFSATEVANLIMQYERDKLNGALKKESEGKSCYNCRCKNDYPKCLNRDNKSACEDYLPLHKQRR